MGIAIIGIGWGARVQVPAFQSAGLEVRALVGRDQGRTQRSADELKVPLALDDWRQALRREDIQLVSIVTPPDLHEPIALAALEAGKHVLCEKPTALSADQARRMLEMAQGRPGQLALIDHELRFLPALQRARQLIAEGAIGAVRQAISLVIGSSRADASRRWDWWSDADQGGGLLGAVGSHQIDTLRFLLGAEVSAVAATLSTDVAQRPAEDGPRRVSSDDGYSLRLRYSNGTRASLEGSLATRLAETNTLTLYGDQGTLRLVEGTLLRAAPGGAFEEITPTHEHELPAGLSGTFPHATVYLAHALRRFLEGDRQAVAPGASFADGLRIQAALDAARRSSATHGGYVDIQAGL